MRASLVPSLLYHPYTEQPYADFPLGILTIATVLERRGLDVAVKDLNLEVLDGRLRYGGGFYEAAADWILDTDPDVVGFSSLCTSFLQALRLAEAVRARKPDAFIVFGGPNVSFVAEPTLAAFSGVVDAVVRGEGEVVTDLLIEALQEGRPLDKVPGLLVRGKVRPSCDKDHPGLVDDLDQLPPPAWHLYPVRHGLDRGYWAGFEIEAGRGCPFACTFCTTSLFWERRYRVKSARFLVEEILELSRAFGVQSFAMVHDLFTCRKRWVEEVCDEFIARGSPVNWSMSARTDSLTPDLVDRLARAGCRDIYFGVESGSPRMQAIIKKRLKLDSVRSILRSVQDHGVRATTSFILGFPQEELEDLEGSLDMFCAYKTQERAQLHLLALYPGIQLVDDLSDLHFDEHLPDGALNLHTERDLKWVRSHPDIFLNYYYLGTRIDRDLLKRIQGYYIATTSYLAHLAAKHCLGERLVDLARAWLDTTTVTFDASRLHVDKLREMADDIAVALRGVFARHGQADVFDDMCRFQRVCYALREQAADWETLVPHPFPEPDAPGLTTRLALRSPIQVIELRYDIPILAEAIVHGRPCSLVPGRHRYLVYIVNDRVRFLRLNRFSAQFLAFCLEGHDLETIAGSMGVEAAETAAPDGLATTAACAWTARELVAAGVLQMVA